MMKLPVCFLLLLGTSWGYGHARLMSPTPRNNNAGIKTGPCGGLARSANPMVVTGGQTLTILWEETINHPGKFIFSLSLADDQGFQNNVLATVPDTQNLGNDLPHRYQTQITIPNIDCPTCTLQMIQSMEENPAMPTFYYSCADLIIRPAGAPVPVPPPAPVPTPPPAASPNVLTQDANLPGQGSNGVKFGQGGCGSVQNASSAQNPWVNLSVVLLLLVPYAIFTYLYLRRLRYQRRSGQAFQAVQARL